MVLTRSSGARITINCGQQPFSFDLYSYMAKHLPDQPQENDSKDGKIEIKHFVLEKVDQVPSSSASVPTAFPSRTEEYTSTTHPEKGDEEPKAAPPSEQNDKDTSEVTAESSTNSPTPTTESETSAEPTGSPAGSTSTSSAIPSFGPMQFEFGEGSSAPVTLRNLISNDRNKVIKRGARARNTLGDVQEGSWLKVLQDINSITTAESSPGLEKAIGCTGLVKGLNPANGTVSFLHLTF